MNIGRKQISTEIARWSQLAQSRVHNRRRRSQWVVERVEEVLIGRKRMKNSIYWLKSIRGKMKDARLRSQSYKTNCIQPQINSKKKRMMSFCAVVQPTPRNFPSQTLLDTTTTSPRSYPSPTPTASNSWAIRIKSPFWVSHTVATKDRLRDHQASFQEAMWWEETRVPMGSRRNIRETVR